MTKALRHITVLALAAAALTGCRSVKLDPSGDMVAVYQFGEFKMLLNTTAPLAAASAQKAVQSEDLYQTLFKQNTYDARIEARTRSDQKVIVLIQEVNSRQTMLRIRWGDGGDLAKSRKLYEAIELGLGR
jgi:ABC-type oligopeptide transport system substrate-binding subunit